MKAKWEKPRILSLEATSTALGDCVGGSTQVFTSYPAGECENGQNTSSAAYAYCDNGSKTTDHPHGCDVGGNTAYCQAGGGVLSCHTGASKG